MGNATAAAGRLIYGHEHQERPKFMPVGTQRAVRDVAQAEYGSRDLHGCWNAGPGTRLDRSRAIGAALTGALDWKRPMKTIVDEAGEIIAKATDDHILIGGHHRLAVAASLGKRLFWRDTGEPVKLDLFFKYYGSSPRHTA
jgi:hypothetical protein